MFPNVRKGIITHDVNKDLGDDPKAQVFTV